MESVTTCTLDVPGAQLRYETRGSGPILLLIPGGWGDAAMFTSLAPLLTDAYTVVTYDPRGLSRSTLVDPTADISVPVQADDAHRVLTAVTGEPALVLGVSGGGITGLALISQHPDQVDTLVAHEPPVVELLPDRAEQHARVEEVCGVHDSDGPGPAMQAFLSAAGLDDDGPADGSPPDPAMLAAFERMKDNLDLFFAHMHRPTAGYLPDATAVRSASTRLVIAGGTQSTGQLARRATAALADHLGRSVTDFPGGHGAFMDQPQEFAHALHQVLAGRM